MKLTLGLLKDGCKISSKMSINIYSRLLKSGLDCKYFDKSTQQVHNP